jgi:long-chain acyl-CoA synthetase
MHSFSALAHVASALSSHLSLDEKERFFSYLPLAHIVERCAIEIASLRLGARVYFAQGIETFMADLERARPTIFISVPRLLLKFQQAVLAAAPPERIERLLRLPLANRLVKRRILRRLGLATVRHAACGAAPLPPETLKWFRRIGLPLAEGYGMTETLITHLPAPGEVRPGYVGQSLAGVETRLGDEGEVQVRSPMNTLGYYRDSTATTQAFTPDRFFRTGDIGEIASDGQLRLVGRIKDQFKTSKGKYVAPAPIESMLSSHPAVEACCLMGAGLPRPFALVLLSAEARKACAAEEGRKFIESSFAARLEEINRELDSHERVEFVALVNGPWSVANGAMTPTLKVKRSALESSYTSLVPAWVARQRPVVWESDPVQKTA